ncbi:MAG: FUSC family protein, partial [Microbacterium sp.]
PEAFTSAIPALTAPLEVRPPASAHWILIGSLMEDLRRIREELVNEG